jgi:hypothetical protein
LSEPGDPGGSIATGLDGRLSEPGGSIATGLDGPLSEPGDPGGG